MPFTKISSGKYRSPSGRTFTSKQVKMYYATGGFKKKAKLKVNNKLKGALGQMDTKTNKIEINVKAHKGDRAELASTIKHELMHVNHPKAPEKEVYKKTAKTKIPSKEQTQLIKKLAMSQKRKTNYKVGALKRKFKMKKNDKIEAGSFISRANRAKSISKKDLAIRGLI